MKQDEYPPEILERLVLGRKKTMGPQCSEWDSDNLTMPLSLLEVKHFAKPCEDCGKEVVNRQQTIRRNHNPAQPDWKIVCNGCGKCKGPDGTYTMTPPQLDRYYRLEETAKKQALKEKKDK